MDVIEGNFFKNSHNENVALLGLPYFCKKKGMKTEYQQAVINRIKHIREEKGLTQLSLAKMLNISPGQMGNIDSYRQPHKYTIKQIMTICDSMGVKIEEILFNEKAESKIYTVREVVCAIIRYQDNSK